MKLHWSPRSPFVRKAMIAAHETGVAERIEQVRTVVAMTQPPGRAILGDNPLGKIPTLVLDDGTVLYDSVVIAEYFDSLEGRHRLFPGEGAPRWLALRRHAMGDGLLDLLILWRNERETAQPTTSWIDSFAVKTTAVLDAMEKEAPALAAAFTIGEIAIGCALSYLDFRFANLDWRKGRPQLTAWYETFCQRPSVKATEIVDG